MKNFCEDLFFFGEHLRLCPWSLALASSIPVLGLESVCPRKGCPWPRIFLCPWPWPRALCPRLHLCYTISDIVLKFYMLIFNRYCVQQRTQDFGNEGAGNSENLRIANTRMKIFPPRISPVFLSKSGEDQKKNVFT